MTAWGVAFLQSAQHEFMLVAAVGILVLGAEDLLFDILWFVRCWRKTDGAEAAVAAQGPIAVFVPAWQEAVILPATIDRMMRLWGQEDVRIYIGCYANDGATLLAISQSVAAQPKIRLVIAPHAGPTSKADNLNQMWQALVSDNDHSDHPCIAVVLHDAEDMVHAEELALYRRHLPDAAMVQIPVEPLLQAGDPVYTAHYADEFAEAHAKELPLRAALRAGLPSAGVGCAFSFSALAFLARDRVDGPFSTDSLTEDYELGLMLGAQGYACRFVDARASDGSRIATRSAFPVTLDTAVRQKARWITGISFAGWDRLDWTGGRKGWAACMGRAGQGRWRTRWMLWRDRRAGLSAIVIFCAYAALALSAIDLLGVRASWWGAIPIDPWLGSVLSLNAMLLLWRLAVRAYCVATIYGWAQGLASIPRTFISNIIHMLASRRALVLYLRQLHCQEIIWEKTEHFALPMPRSGDAVRGAS